MIISEKQPWECPRCHKINAHWLAQCFCLSDADKQAQGFNQTISNHTIRDATKLDRCLVCNGFHGVGIQCVYLKVQS